MSKGTYVFVVCGDKEHIDSLHFSLNYLKHYSSNEVLVLTDSSRNEIEILHDSVIDVITPKEFDHHQASIYLKTGIHRFLPKGKLYCYLDTDVIAISHDCDRIFSEYLAPITFAPDHCSMRSFSAYAVNCGCLDKCEADRKRFFKSLNKYDRNDELSTSFAKTQRRIIEDKYRKIQKSFLSKLFYAAKYYLSYPKFWLDQNLYFDKSRKLWATKNGEIVKYELDVKSIAKEANLKYTLWFNQWKNQKGENIFETDCDHLKEVIQSTFKVEVQDNDWQHWNGGVFLFSDESHAFLDEWHSKSISIFNLNTWKTRDQGTLIATVWNNGLQNHPTLSKAWNFIADFHNNQLTVSQGTDIISDDLFKTTHEAKFVHVFHEWGNKNWEVWRWIENKKPSS